MKLLLSLLAAVCAGCLARGVLPLTEKASRPAPDFITRALRKAALALMARDLHPVSRYVRHVTPLVMEVPLPEPIDLPLFLSLHAVSGILLWLLAAFAYPAAAACLLPVCIGLGMGVPYLWLKHRQAMLHAVLLKSLPDCLDLLALVMEAGLDLNAGLQHYIENGAHGPLRDLLRDAQKEIQMGRSRSDAFSCLAGKTLFGPLRETCRGIVQALSLGSRLAPFLRGQAAELRVKRMQRAEKKAAEAPLKVLFPLFIFIFPTIFIVLLGPMMILLTRGGF